MVRISRTALGVLRVTLSTSICSISENLLLDGNNTDNATTIINDAKPSDEVNLKISLEFDGIRKILKELEIGSSSPELFTIPFQEGSSKGDYR